MQAEVFSTKLANIVIEANKQMIEEELDWEFNHKGQKWRGPDSFSVDFRIK